MIFPEETKPLSSRKKFITFDIETKGDNFDFLDGAICFDYPDCEFFATANDMIKRIIEKLGCDSSLTLYGHNAGRFDCIILLNELISHFEDIQILMSSSIVIGWTCTTKHQRITFLDSMRLINMSLKTATSKFNVKNKKIEIDCLPHILKEKNPSLYFDYLKKDVLGLNEVLSSFAFTMESQFGEFKHFVTIASCAFSIFKRHQSKKIYTPKTEKLREFERQSYKGGICFLNHNGFKKDTIVFDVNSLYPFAMLNSKFPTSERGLWTRKFYGVEKKGIYKIRLLKKIGGFPFLYGKTSLVNEGEVFACESTIQYLLDFKHPFQIIMGYVYLNSDSIFSYMQKLYNLRKSDPSLDTPLKLIMNSSYGKFAQKKERHFVALATSERLKDLRSCEIKYKDYGEFVIWDDIIENHEQFVGIASLILFQSRLIMRKLFDLIPNNKDGKSPIYYVDTDSLHLSVKYLNNLKTHLGSELGQLKKEFEGDALYVGKKLYVLYGNNNYEEKVRSKGFNKAKKEDLEKAYLKQEGEIVETKRFFSLYEGLRGESSIKIIPKRMRKT